MDKYVTEETQTFINVYDSSRVSNIYGSKQCLLHEKTKIDTARHPVRIQVDRSTRALTECRYAERNKRRARSSDRRFTGGHKKNRSQITDTLGLIQKL